jgi:hypothetical protein
MTRPTMPTLDQLLNFDLPGIEVDRLAAVAKDAAYVAVGFGVLTVQRAQVRRRELTAQATNAGNQVREFVAGICR